VIVKEIMSIFEFTVWIGFTVWCTPYAEGGGGHWKALI
jgi:hypothetical protein